MQRVGHPKKRDVAASLPRDGGEKQRSRRDAGAMNAPRTSHWPFVVIPSERSDEGSLFVVARCATIYDAFRLATESAWPGFCCTNAFGRNLCQSLYEPKTASRDDSSGAIHPSTRESLGRQPRNGLKLIAPSSYPEIPLSIEMLPRSGRTHEFKSGLPGFWGSGLSACHPRRRDAIQKPDPYNAKGRAPEKERHHRFAPSRWRRKAEEPALQGPIAAQRFLGGRS